MKLTDAIFTFFAGASGSGLIKCLEVDSTATAQWTNAEKQTCTWNGTVGSNFGMDPVNGGK